MVNVEHHPCLLLSPVHQITGSNQVSASSYHLQQSGSESSEFARQTSPPPFPPVDHHLIEASLGIDATSKQCKLPNIPSDKMHVEHHPARYLLPPIDHLIKLVSAKMLK
ncbi:hypothetical protein ACHAWU_000014 [Discostella pseudostelligera]|uniref:Uncharacterized protein n=1 Tax=Discostella pseudostelligera TaxID=259834 RepID=A0ABD3MDI7_9STRA